MPTLEEWLRKTYGSDLSKVTEIKDVPRDVTGKFFFLLADQCAFFGRIFFYENLARIFASGSHNLQKIPGKFLAPLTPALPACQSYSNQATSKC